MKPYGVARNYCKEVISLSSFTYKVFQFDDAMVSKTNIFVLFYMKLWRVVNADLGFYLYSWNINAMPLVEDKLASDNSHSNIFLSGYILAKSAFNIARLIQMISILFV